MPPSFRIIDEYGNQFWLEHAGKPFFKGMGDDAEIKRENRVENVLKNRYTKHRENDLPAVINVDGTKEWWIKGLRHRAGGLPAIQHWNGTKIWYMNGKRHRDNDLPAIEYSNGNKAWYKAGCLHRDEGPAILNADGTKEYWLNGSFDEQGPMKEELKILREKVKTYEQ